MVCSQTGATLSVKLENGKIFRKTKHTPSIEALAIRFRNAPKPPEKIGKIENVTAHITYYKPFYPPKSGVMEKEVFNACWLNEAAPQVSFNTNEHCHLIIGTMEQKTSSGDMRQFVVYENSLDTKKPLTNVDWNIQGWSRITVKLSWGANYEYGKEFDFKLNIKLNGHYDLIHLSDEIKQKRRSETIQFLQKYDAEGLNLLNSFNKNNKDNFVIKKDEWRKTTSDFILERLGMPTYKDFTVINKLSEYSALTKEESDESVNELYTLKTKLQMYRNQVYKDYDSF